MTLVRTGMKRLMMIALASGALLLGACSSSGNDAPTAPGAGAPGLSDQDRKEAAPPDAQAPQGVTATTGPVAGRSLIYRGDITVRVDDVEIAADKVQALAGTLGGHISSEKRSTGSDDASAQITIRVPSDKFQSALDTIATYGTEQNRGSNTDDVTEAVIDLDTRIAAQKASVESVRRMFDQATSLSDVVLLERELSQREAELASLEARKRQLDDLVALSTINVSLIGPNTEIPVEKKRQPGFMGGLEAGWDAFVTSVRVLLVVLGFMLPFLIAIAIPIVLLVWLARRRRLERGRESS